MNVHQHGESTSFEVIQQFVTLNGKKLLDVGCGDMTFSKPLVKLGAHVIGIDPDPIQAEKNRATLPIPAIDFVECGADAIPMLDNSIDGVLFSFSLHHIPATIYPQVFDEVMRVLKPTGFLIVVEPGDCPFYSIMKLFHDEDKEKAEAQKALHEIAANRFNHIDIVHYHSFFEYESFEQFANRMAGKSFNELYSEEDVRAPTVQRAFEQQGPPFRFESPKICWIGRHSIDESLKFSD